MPLAYKEITSNGQAAQVLEFTFDYISSDDIFVFVDGTQKTRPTDWNFSSTNSQRIVFVNHPSNGANIRIERRTPATTRNVDFQDGSVLSEKDLDDSARQIFFVAQEASDTANDAVTVDVDGKIDGQSRNIKNVAAPTENDHAVNLGFLNTNITAVNNVNNNMADVNNLDTNMSDINTVATNISDVNTVSTYSDNVNAFSNYYKVGSTQPTGNIDGRLWWDSAQNVLKLYNGDTSAFQTYNTGRTTEFNGLSIDSDGNLQWTHGNGNTATENYRDWFFGLSDLTLEIDDDGHLIARY